MRLIDADALMMSLADWWCSSFGEKETEDAKAIHAVMDKVEEYIQSSAQLEQSDASEFWRKRADYYSDLCMRLIAEMGKGAKIESVKISENGIEFIKEQPSAQLEVRSVEQTIKGYSIDQLILIANVLKRENLPPERVAEALTDMQRVIAMVRSEFEESLRQSVKWFVEDDLK